MDTNPTRRRFIKSALLTAGAALTITQTGQAIEPIKRSFGGKLKSSCAAYSYRKYLGEDKSMTMMDFLDECAKMGCDAAEPTSYYFTGKEDEAYWMRFRQKAFLLGLDISGTAIGNTFTFPAGPDREKNLALTRMWIDHAYSMGAPVIRIFAGKVDKGQTREEAIRNSIETTRIACEYAGTKGVYLALENHGGIVERPDEMLEIVKGVDSEWFGVNLDSGNFHGDDPYKDMEQIAPYAVNAQVKIAIRRANGQQEETDYDRVVGILMDSGYRGYAALEYEGDDEPKEAIPRYMEKLMKAIERV
ncbi:MAG: TIM barrel protein [bacterium]|nr:TIM barrel protein [bacterium]